jgi:Glycosyl transferase family 11
MGAAIGPCAGGDRNQLRSALEVPAIYVRISGGLGNQLFQFAAGYALAKRSGQALKFDLTQYNEAHPFRTFGLDRIGALISKANETELRRFWPRAGKPAVFAAHHPRVAQALCRIIAPGKRMPIFERSEVFVPEVWHAKALVYLSGVWSSERYFEDCSSDIRRIFNAALTPPQGAPMHGTRVAVHVRLTDFKAGNKTAKYRGSCDASYYRKAMAFFHDRFSDVQFQVFSDDIAGARRLLAGMGQVIFMETQTNSAWDDLSAMAGCDHNIIANSSYSWWTAWLNPNPKKIVIAPRQWFSRVYQRQNDCIDVVPPGWLTMDADDYGDRKVPITSL